MVQFEGTKFLAFLQTGCFKLVFYKLVPFRSTCQRINLSFFTLEELAPNMKESAFWLVRTITRDVRNRSEKQRKNSKIAIASRSTTECAISPCFKVLAKKLTGFLPWLIVAPILVPDASIWRTMGSFAHGGVRVQPRQLPS